MDGRITKSPVLPVRFIVLGGMFAAFYAVATLAIAPLSYGAIQFRVSNLLKPMALFNPAFALSIAIGTFLANLFSPFGPWDWAIMPIVDIFAAIVCWKLRRVPFVAIIAQSVIVSIGVCLFPLGIAARLPIETTFLPVLIPNIIAPLIGYCLIWKREDLRAFISQGA